MSVKDLLMLVTQGFFVLVGALTLVDLLRHRDRARFDIALPFTALAVTTSIGIVGGLTGKPAPPWLSAISSLILIAQPYLLLRLVEHFGRVPRLIHALVLVAFVLSGAILVAFPPPLPAVAALPVVIYFGLGEGYAGVVFIRRALTTRGVAHHRLIFAALGTGLLGGIILMAGVIILVPTLRNIATPVLSLGALLAGLSFYLGFAPPRALRRAWQLTELYRFLQELAGSPTTAQTSATLDTLCRAASQAVGGLTAVAAVWDDNKKQLIPQGAGDNSLLSAALAAEGAVGRAWQERCPVIARSLADQGADVRQMAQALGANVIYIIPIVTARNAWGLLLVFNRGALFPEDDVDLLVLLAEQAAISLENTDLLAQQRVWIDRLKNEITERKRVEKKIRQLNKMLSQRAVELETANKELEAFSYSVSHDLRAPLRAIDGFSRILQQDYGPQLVPEIQRYLGLVRDNAQQMGHLIDDLLTFSRLSRQPLKKQSVTPAGVANQALEDLRPEQDGRQLDVTVGDLPSCHADPALLRQVFVNLMSNALKFTRQRDVARVEVGWKQLDGQHAYYVKDNGAGFDMQYADKLFGVFQRLHRAEEYEGTGVGLAIVQRIVHRHGGRVWVEAVVDQGATFYFTLGGDGDDER